VASISRPAFQLRYSWAGWPSKGGLPESSAPEFWEQLEQAWETDGIRRLEDRWRSDQVQITLSAKPHVSPFLLSAGVKGRLQHALKQAGTLADFSRKLSLCSSLGDA
jgi:hypothetical protein